MGNITLQFGKYRGWSFENIVKSDREYIVWLAKAGIERQNASKEALDFLGGRAISFNASIASKDELEQMEEERQREAEEIQEEYSREAWEKKFRIAWEASGHSISIELRCRNAFEYDYYYRVEVDGQRKQCQPEDIKSYSNAARPEIVARLGQAGLTQERKDALVAMWNLRNEWFSPVC